MAALTAAAVALSNIPTPNVPLSMGSENDQKTTNSIKDEKSNTGLDENEKKRKIGESLSSSSSNVSKSASFIDDRDNDTKRVCTQTSNVSNPQKKDTSTNRGKDVEIVKVDEFEIISATSAIQSLARARLLYRPAQPRFHSKITMTRAEQRAAAREQPEQPTNNSQPQSSNSSQHDDNTENIDSDDDEMEEDEEEEELPKPPVVIDPESGKTLRRSARSTRCPSHLRNSILEAPGLRLEQAQHLDTFQIDHMNKRKAKKEKNDKDQDDEDERKPRGGYRRELVAGSRQHPGNRPLFPLELQAMFKDERCRNIIEFDPVEAPGLRLEQAQHLDTFQIDHMNKRKAKKAKKAKKEKKEKKEQKEKNDNDQDDEDPTEPRKVYQRELVPGSRMHPGNRPLFPLELQAMFKDERCRNIIEFDPVTSVIRVLDIERFEAEVMPRHFNTYTHKTFQRQMSYYNFMCCDEEGRSTHKTIKRISKLCYRHRTIDLKHVDDFTKVTRVNVKPRIRPRKGKRRRLEAELASKHRPSKQQNTSSYDHISSSSQRGVLSTIISQSAVSTGLRDSSHASRRIVSSMLPSSSCAEEDSYSSSSSVSDHADSKAATTNDTTTNADWQDDSAHQLLLQIRNFPRRTEK
eukprot:CAMPEP_0197301978 /NCGR_PEP_ID=MMETSP0890-20130614/50749_1 /TAXON_ID=44058 ORGANISM="Aureoumbra lagunensis, Strain CCMP1510" /NCGR_SAMPLE_ID=MMETSP0890 /ASSEMBLY_ACC=CAM_ASM_000533 /LENGTH=631 /DNA_ID=CAMNT_0042781451 /DNA_START=486 /DNA_END=2382 /DNA_ORIENTATION=-